MYEHCNHDDAVFILSSVFDNWSLYKMKLKKVEMLHDSIKKLFIYNVPISSHFQIFVIRYNFMK